MAQSIIMSLLNYHYSLGYIRLSKFFIINHATDNEIRTIATSIKIDRIKAGIVIFVGRAARFVTSDRAIAPRHAMINAKLPLVVITAIAVNGVKREA